MHAKLAQIAIKLAASEDGRKVLMGILVLIIAIPILVVSIFLPITGFVFGVKSMFSSEEDIEWDDEMDLDTLLDDTFVITNTKYYKAIDKARTAYITDATKRLEERAKEIKKENEVVEMVERILGNGDIVADSVTIQPEVNIHPPAPPYNLAIAYFLIIENTKDFLTEDIKIKKKDIIDFYKLLENDTFTEQKVDDRNFNLWLTYKTDEEFITYLKSTGYLLDDADEDLFRVALERIEEYLISAGLSSYSGTPAGSISDLSVAKQIWDYLKAKGWSDYATAAILGNIEAESSFRTTVEEKGGTGVGLFQWSYSRRDRFLNYMEENGYDLSSVEGQLEYLLHEDVWYGGNRTLYNSDGIKHQAKAGSLSEFGTYSYEALADAVEDFCWHWESPNYKKANMDKRQGAALEALNLFTSSGKVATGSYAQIKASYFPLGAVPKTAAEMQQYLVTISFQNSAGVKKSLTVHKLVAADLLKALEEISASGYEIKEIGGYSFRPKAGSSGGNLSSHSYGLAIDINHNFGNPFIKNGRIIAGTAYGSSHLSMYANSAPVLILKAAGWKWGGEWTSSKDYMHFSVPGG